MLRIIRASRLGICLVLSCTAILWSEAFPQEAGSNAQQPITQAGSAPIVDFEVKIAPPGNKFLVRRKGTQEWTESSELSEPVAVGLLDGTCLIYVVSKAIKPPKAKHMEAPTYPESEKKSGNERKAILHVVVDGKGNVRIPTADSSPGPVFAKAAIEAVKKWKFEPATLNGEPVAVLITIEIEFRLY
jgi:TonB family protein